jgi:hypothetical protein
MPGQPHFQRTLATVILIPGALLLLSNPLAAQQKYVTQWDVYTGYAFLNSPKIGLFENGFQGQLGYRVRTWVSLGFDYSLTAGDLTITPDLLPAALQQQLGAQLGQMIKAGLIPASYSLTVPAHSITNSFAAGPQFAYRHFQKVTIFIRPSVGAIREGATPKPTDAVATAIVKELAPAGHKTDWQGFYGIGGGFDINFSKHFALRTQADYVWDHLFNDLLQDGRWTTRFSVGPCFNFGKNVAATKPLALRH